MSLFYTVWLVKHQKYIELLYFKEVDIPMNYISFIMSQLLCLFFFRQCLGIKD